MHRYICKQILIYIYVHAYTCVYLRIYSNKHTHLSKVEREEKTAVAQKGDSTYVRARNPMKKFMLIL
jgi:hypothetical protein